ncbi:putative histidine kinase [Paratrimastix pyriformis]|uniref:Histidine kinase n=1 Tax=Paratrimastix pyriformis TaxID=342808 RepID=A0ABQ8UM18_9EUKA|nr:putative histidine kinase [Paratrimastix pyriformis]
MSRGPKPTISWDFNLLGIEGKDGPVKITELQRLKVHEILLVASPYDLFLMEEDGAIVMSLTNNTYFLQQPNITRSSTQADAEKLLAQRKFDLIVTVHQFNDAGMFKMIKCLQDRAPSTYIVPLCASLIGNYVVPQDLGLNLALISRPFIWAGDASVFMAIVKSYEDSMNAPQDTPSGVRVILYAESDPVASSKMLPVLYEMLLQMSLTGVNPQHRLARRKARPKILFATNLEEASALATKYCKNLLGVISNTHLAPTAAASPAPDAGLQLQQTCGALSSSHCFLLVSQDPDMQHSAEQTGSLFVNLESAGLRRQMRHFFEYHLGFGDFVFRLPNQEEVARAQDLAEITDLLAKVPAESVVYLGQRHYFSNWLFARGEFGLAVFLRDFNTAQFEGDAESLRAFLVDSFKRYRHAHSRGLAIDFSTDVLKLEDSYYMKIGAGSLGGKARGLLFFERLLSTLRHEYPQVVLRIPRTVVLATDIFDAFIEQNGLEHLADPEGPVTDDQIAEAFVEAALPAIVCTQLRLLVEHTSWPLAVRSSSLLEVARFPIPTACRASPSGGRCVTDHLLFISDSRNQPLAGIYSTHMVPNSARASVDERCEQLYRAVKLVYASTYFEAARGYLDVVGFSSSNEKMAVLIQEVVGTEHHRRFYPDVAAHRGLAFLGAVLVWTGSPYDDHMGMGVGQISGVAQSYNFYALDGMHAEDGIASVALGLGRTVVDGGVCWKFGLARPEIPYLFSPKEMLRDSQKDFWAVNLDDEHVQMLPTRDEATLVSKYNLAAAEEDGTLHHVGSTFNFEDQRVVDSVVLGEPGRSARMVTFARILKYETFPLAALLQKVIKLAEWGMASPVEIEFAVNLSTTPHEMVMLQMRPMQGPSNSNVTAALTQAVAELPREALVARSGLAMGHGRYPDIADILYVKRQAFDRVLTDKIAAEFAQYNNELKEQGTPFVAVGLGRWGTSNASLGTPLDWSKISGAKVLLETGLPDYIIDPSFGSHFMHNILGLRIPFMYIHPTKPSDLFAWEFLDSQPVVSEKQFVRHIRVATPLQILVDGPRRAGLITRGGIPLDIPTTLTVQATGATTTTSRHLRRKRAQTPGSSALPLPADAVTKRAHADGTPPGAAAAAPSLASSLGSSPETIGHCGCHAAAMASPMLSRNAVRRSTSFADSYYAQPPPPSSSPTMDVTMSPPPPPVSGTPSGETASDAEWAAWWASLPSHQTFYYE